MQSIVLVDNYVDESVLTLLSKRNNLVTATIYTSSVSKQLKLDLKRFNSQKDLGKKWFAFSRIEIDAMEMIKKLNLADHE